MNEETWSRLEAAFEENREMVVAGPLSKTLVEETIGRLGGPLVPEYVEFVTRYGGAVVGVDPIFGLRPAEAMAVDATVEAKTRRFRKDEWPGTENALVVSIDPRGNPVWLGPDGHVRTFDHDSGEQLELAGSFESYLLQLLMPRHVAPTGAESSPPTPLMAAAWRAAAADLGIRFISPFRLRVDGKSVLSTGWLPDFGGPKGTAIHGRYDSDEAWAATEEQGYYTSGLNPLYYEHYDRGIFVETLNDWGWFGPGEPPPWFEGGLERHGGR